MIKKIAVAVLAGSALLGAAGAAQAHHAGAIGHGDGYYQGAYYNSYPYRYAPRYRHSYRPVYRPYSYYYPAPRYSRYYYEPSPTIYGRSPIGNGSIGFRLPL